MKGLSVIAIILTIVGAVNWGLVGLGQLLGTNLNVVNLLLGSWPIVESIIYLLVGVSGLIVAFTRCGK
jgi:uncharacterized membrane protein YuzA (DUF378 family)